jgi:hypothetical protein
VQNLPKRLAELELGLTFKLASTILFISSFCIVMYYPPALLSLMLLVLLTDMVGVYLCCSAPVGPIGWISVRLSALLNSGCLAVPLALYVNSSLKKFQMPYSMELAQNNPEAILGTVLLCDIVSRLLFFVFLTQLASKLDDPGNQTRAGVTAIMLLLLYMFAAIIKYNFHHEKNVAPLLSLIPMIPLAIYYTERYMGCLYDLKQGVSMAGLKANEQANVPEPMRMR